MEEIYFNPSERGKDLQSGLGCFRNKYRNNNIDTTVIISTAVNTIDHGNTEASLQYMAQVSTLSSSSYLPVMVIQLMKERERRFHILPPGVRSVGQVAHIAQGSAASLLSGTLEPLWPLASVMPTPAPGVDCPLQAGGHETRGRAQPQHTGSRGPEDGWRGRGHSAVCQHRDHGATCPLTLPSPHTDKMGQVTV